MHNEAVVPTQGPGRRYGVTSVPAGFNNGATDVALHAHQVALQNAALMEEGVGTLVGPFGGLNIPAGGNLAQAGLPNFVNAGDATVLFGGPYGGHVQALYPEHAYGASYQVPYAAGYGTGFGGPMMSFATPGRAVTFAERIPRDIPALENRRASYSTSGTESTPATPFFGNNADRVNSARVNPIDRSSYTTPSPRETIANYVSMHGGPSKPIVDPEIERLLMKDPPIPRAVPAVWTEVIKPLEQCLENRIHGNRNVYIRGLHPTTDDDLLLKYAVRFGEVEQSKAILDTATGACKG